MFYDLIIRDKSNCIFELYNFFQKKILINFLKIIKISFSDNQSFLALSDS